MAPQDNPLPSRRATIRNVAEDAGVSVAAVSKVLRNAYGVSEALRENVLASIERLGYRPNLAARGLRGQSFTIGVLLTEIANPFLSQIVDGVQEAIEPSGYNCMIAVGRTDVSLETRLIETMIDFRMDGVILVAPLLGTPVIERFARQIPVVVIAHHEPQARSFDTVSGDDRRGGRLATEALLARGHREVAMLALDHPSAQGTNVSEQRQLGYLDAMGAAGLPDRVRILRASPDLRQSEGQLAALLDAPDRPRALFCWSDLHGVQLHSLAVRRGLRLPDELALVAYDNSSVAALPLVDLTSVDQDGHGQGATAAAALLSRIGGRREARHVLLEPRLVARSSA